ncbi:MAG: FHA domain-containing protein [Kofleriaceae bacterium]
MTVCNRCGKENQDHYKFCLGCGAELTAAPKAGGDVAMMKTMMADPGSSPLGGAPLGGSGPIGSPLAGLGSPNTAPVPGGPLRGPSAAMPQALPPRPSGQTSPAPMLGMPPPGPLGGPPLPPPMGPPPGVPGFSPGFAQPASAAPAMRRCPSCGSDVPPTFRFCGTCGFRMDEGSAPMPLPTGPGAALGAPQVQRSRLSMTLIRPDGSEGGVHELHPGENKLGRSFGPVFENDGYLSPVHAQLDIRGQTASLRDLDSLNGVFVKMTQEEELANGQILRIGQELLRFELIAAPEPTADGTELMGSPNPGYWGKLTVIIGRDITGAAFPLLGDAVTLGRERGEINFPDDGYVSGLHARITLRDGRVYLSDLGSSNGTFIKVNGERTVGHESFVLLGQQLFRIGLS